MNSLIMSILANPESIRLLRYLIVWRVNGSLVWLPKCIATELSAILGEIIAKRLPTKEARPWQKVLEASDKGFDLSWPMEAVLLVYPSKRTYGAGELIIWELKLFGDSADHGFFLEVILPAMEEAGYITDKPWYKPNRLWGRFEIHSVYVARGYEWEPLVREGQLDLRYRATPVQWAEGLDLRKDTGWQYDSPTRLSWIGSFDLEVGSSKPQKKGKLLLRSILDALSFRIESLNLGLEEDPDIQEAREQADQVPVIHNGIKTASKRQPGRRVGSQLLAHVPDLLIPYLELASIIHVGKYTHLGCGTFSLIRSTVEAF